MCDDKVPIRLHVSEMNALQSVFRLHVKKTFKQSLGIYIAALLGLFLEVLVTETIRKRIGFHSRAGYQWRRYRVGVTRGGNRRAPKRFLTIFK